MEIKLEKFDTEFNIIIKPDKSAYINGNEAFFSPLYNAVILNNGAVLRNKSGDIIIDEDDSEINGLRLTGKTLEKVKNFISKYENKIEDIKEKQLNYVPKLLKLNKDQFYYDDIDDYRLAESKVVSRLNLLFKGDTKLLKKISKFLDEDNLIDTNILLDLKEYKDFVEGMEVHEQQIEQEKQLKNEFEKFIKKKIGVGIKTCMGCNRYRIVGKAEEGFLTNEQYGNALDQLNKEDYLENKYMNLCEIITKDFYYVNKGTQRNCKYCRI